MTTAIAVETYTCESCPATDPDLFTAFEAGETDGDQVCDDCHHEHAASASPTAPTPTPTTAARSPP